MANIKQQKKRIRTAQRQRMENLRYKSTVAKHFLTSFKRFVDAGDKDAAIVTHKELVQLIGRDKEWCVSCK